MIFESMWPLAFLAAVPVIIILYLLKPKGSDYRISSNLLWQKLLKNQQSKTFFEKFVHNILMYIQILIVLLLIIALMSPFIRTEGMGGGRKLLLMDTSGSMQHKGSDGKTRLEEAVEQACDYVRASGNTGFSVVTTDATGTSLLAVDSTDKSRVIQILQSLECSDAGSSPGEVGGVLDALTGENKVDLLIFTDGAGIGDFDELQSSGEKSIYVVGESASNLANEYVVFSQREDGLYDVVVSIVNYSAAEAGFDVSIHDADGGMLGLRSMKIGAAQSAVCLFEQVDWKGETLSAKISGISFASGASDSLEQDNLSLTVKSRSNQIGGLLVGNGNTFIEKAYKAVTGENVTKAASDIVSGDASYNVVIYDAGQTATDEKSNRLVFGDTNATVAETLENVVLDMTDCDLTAGLSGFQVGVNKAYVLEVPEGAKSFITYNGKCVGYYGEVQGRKEVVVGFDIRESDFPLRAEFPIFLANAMIYLSDTSWLAAHTFYAGEEIALQPWAEPEETDLQRTAVKAGLYRIGNKDYEEFYTVRFRTDTESDGQKTGESVIGTNEVQKQKVKQTLRNVFLVLALLLLLAEWVIYVRQMRYKGIFYTAVRATVFICVLLALLDIRISLGNSDTATIFVVDLSDSNEAHLEEAGAYIGDMVGEMPGGNSYGIVTFGKNALVEQFLTDNQNYGGLMTAPETAATNLEDAVSKALTLIPGDAKGRLVVLTDGKETRGDIHRLAKVITAGETEFLTLLYETEQTKDAYIDNVTLPSYLHPGDKYSVQVEVESNYDTDAVLTIYNGSKQTSAVNVHLNKGSNRFVIAQQVGEEVGKNAMESIRVRVQAPEDSCEENDAYSAYSVVEAAPRTLVIAGKNASTSAFTPVLTAAGCDYSVVASYNAPKTIQDMLDYKTIILVDTYIDDLPVGFLENLESYVKDYGCGFVCCGGEDSFALGGYRDTVLETVLPVDMQLRSVNEAPSMAMVMVIDHSGSMLSEASGTGATNLDIAIRAATVAVDNLRDSDYVGVLTFDDKYKWQVEITPASDKTGIKNKIKQISEGGGTTIKPAVAEAYRAIMQSDASVKHVVLLTDGMGETTNYSDVIKAYADSGVTLSTVAVGQGSDTQLLERLAKQCGGRYYYSDLSSDIPKIFAQEVFLGGDSYIQNGDFALQIRGSHEVTNGLFRDGWPLIHGYVAATPKTASRSLIVSAEKEDPILTLWQYGLGRTVAWNSDVTGEWTGSFAGQNDYVGLWKRIVDYSAGNADMGQDRVDVVTAGETTRAYYEALDYSADTEIWATVISPEEESAEVKFRAVAPGKYEAEIGTPLTGMYYFNIRRTEEGEITGYMNTAASVQFSDEYKYDVSRDSYVSFAEKYGKIIGPEDNIWNRINASAKKKKSLTNLLLGLAVFLFLADVAMRRFCYVPNLPKRKRASNPMVDEKLPPVEEINPAAEEKNAAESAKVPKAKEKAPSKKKKPKQLQQTLDTSQLLKKKDDRNI